MKRFLLLLGTLALLAPFSAAASATKDREPAYISHGAEVALADHRVPG